MKYAFVVILTAIPSFALCGVNKCTDSSGHVSYSDNPCKVGEKKDSIEVKTQHWTKQIEFEKSKNITIKNISKGDGSYTITFQFKTMDDSNTFLRLINKLSHQNSLMTKFIASNGDKPGEATVYVSERKIEVLESLKNKSNGSP